MNPILPNKEKELRELKEKIAELKDYIASDFCKTCERYYNDIETLENKVKELEQ